MFAGCTSICRLDALQINVCGFKDFVMHDTSSTVVKRNVRHESKPFLQRFIHQDKVLYSQDRLLIGELCIKSKI